MITHDIITSKLIYCHSLGFFVDRRTGNVKRVSSTTKGYSRISINNENIQAHIAAWIYHYGDYPIGQIDHINRNKRDNRIANLRDVSAHINMMNRGLQKRSKYKCPGITKYGNKYRLSISRVYLGLFDTVELACKRRREYLLEKYNDDSLIL